MAEAQAPQPQAAPDKHVFISYASADKAVADSVCDALERAGVLCWIAPRDVVPGENYAGAIVHAIDATRIIVLVLSKHSADSQHVLREVERASSKRHPVISFRIDAEPLPAALEYFLNSSQWLDATTTGVDRSLLRLVDAVRIALSLPSSATRAAATLPASARSGGRRRTALIAATFIITAALAYLAVDKSRFPTRAPTPPPTTPATPAAAISDKSIAVLPFVDMSEKHDQEYFGDGMAEEILDLLAKIPGLTVIGRTSSFSFKGKNEDLRTIGTKLNAAHILEGSVRNYGEQIRITAQLINARTGAHEWSETYDRPFGDVLKLQDAIALAVTRQLQLTVVPADLDSRATLNSTEAYSLMLRGRNAFDRLDKEGYDEAIPLFQEALDRDPTLADAASWLGRIYETMGEAGYAAPGLVFEQSRRMAELALKLNSRSAEAHALLANIHIVYDWDWAAAEREIQKAKLIAPGDPYVLRAGAILALTLGRWDDALKHIRAAILIDPFDPINYQWMSYIQENLGQWSEAEGFVRRMLEISPTYNSMHSYLSYLLWKQGNLDGALKEMQKETNREVKQGGMVWVLYAVGRKAESDTALAEYIKGHAATDAYNIADIYARRGRPDEAIRWLERAFDQKDIWLAFIKSDTSLDSLDNDPRYKALLRKMNLPE